MSQNINRSIINSVDPSKGVDKLKEEEEEVVEHSQSLKETFLERVNLNQYSVMIKASPLQLFFY